MMPLFDSVSRTEWPMVGNCVKKAVDDLERLQNVRTGQQNDSLSELLIFHYQRSKYVTSTQFITGPNNGWFRERDLNWQHALRRLPLTCTHLQACLQWCRVRWIWNLIECSRIDFSDFNWVPMITKDMCVDVQNCGGIPSQYHSPHSQTNRSYDLQSCNW